MEKRKAIIVDVDGTLVHNTSGRGWYDYSKVHLDTVDEEVRRIVEFYRLAGYAIIICTGREDKDGCREATISSLENNEVIFDEYFMRAKGDEREDSMIKEEILYCDILPKYDVVLSLDDRNSVVDMWRSNGIKTLQCGPGDF